MAPRRSWVKADNPFWSNHVAAWYRSALDAERYCRKHDLSTASLMRWTRHLLSAEDLRKHAEDLCKAARMTKNAQVIGSQGLSRRALGQVVEATRTVVAEAEPEGKRILPERKIRIEVDRGFEFLHGRLDLPYQQERAAEGPVPLRIEGIERHAMAGAIEGFPGRA